jgi:hypothetical protein
MNMPVRLANCLKYSRSLMSVSSVILGSSPASSGAGYDLGGVRAVYTSYNKNHGDALQAFYGQYRLITYDPEKTPTKVSDSPFWVKIVD